MSSVSRRPLVLTGAATFAFWVSLYLYAAVLPLRAEELGASEAMIGAVVAAYAIGQVTLRIPIGIASDLWGRKPFALLSIALCGIGAAWLGAAPDPWSLFAARTLVGIGAAGWVAISVLYSSHFPSERPGRAMTHAMTINASAVMISTLVGGEIAERLGTATPFFAAAGMAAAGALLLVPASEPERSRATSASASLRSLFRLLRSPLLLQVSSIAIGVQFVTFAVSFGFLPIYARDLGATKAEIGYITTAGLASAIVGTAVSGWIAQRAGSRAALVFAASGTVLSLLAMPFTGGLVLLSAEQALNGFARGVMNTLLISLALQAAPPSERATGMGTYQALYAIGMLGGPAISGAIAGGLGIDWVFWASAIVCAAATSTVFLRRLPQL